MESTRLQLRLNENTIIYIESQEDWANSSLVKEDKPTFFHHSRDFSEAVEAIRPVIDQAIAPLKGLEHKPKEIELEFGFSFGADSELILQRGGGNSHIQVKLKYDSLE